jgi:hypothetical protein
MEYGVSGMEYATTTTTTTTAATTTTITSTSLPCRGVGMDSYYSAIALVRLDD